MLLCGSITALLMAAGAVTSVSGQTRAADEAIVPFKIQVPEETLRDLKDGWLAHAFPRKFQQPAGTTAPTSTYLKSLVAYWRDRFDWRAQERKLNEFDQFKTTIDGLEIHFIHQKSKVPNAFPLAAHAWVARLDRRVHEGDRTADRSGEVRRPRRGCLQRGRHLAARFRLLRQAAGARLQPGEDGRRSSPS